MDELRRIWKRELFILTTIAIAFGMISTPFSAKASSGNEFYVALNGNDSNPGTLGEPWKTIQHAVDTVHPGDIIYLRGGTYHESVQFHQSGEQGNPIALTNYMDETVTIDGDANPVIVDRDGTQYWAIVGLNLDSDTEFTIQFDAWGCDGTCRGTHHWIIRNNRIMGAVQIYGSYNLFESNEVDGSQHKGFENGVWELYDVSHHNIFRDNHIHHFYSRGIWSMHRTHDDIFENNYIHHIGDDTEGMCIDTDGFSTVEWRHTIRGNHLHNCGESGIELENTFDSIVENNIIHDTGRRGIDIINYGPHIGPEGKKCEAGGENDQYGDTDGNNDCEGNLTGNIIRQNLIYNGAQHGAIVIYLAGGISIWGNTIANTSGPGIMLYGELELCPEIDIRSNIIADSGYTAISVEEAASLSQDNHNLLHQTGLKDVYEIRNIWTNYTLSEYQAATGKGQGSIQADPRFVDPGNNNFHLQDISPAIDAGVNIGLTTDLDGSPRPQGSGYDIGAYEFGVVGPTSTPIPSPTVPPPSPTSTPSPTTVPPSPTIEPSTTALPPTPTQASSPTPTPTNTQTKTPTSTSTKTSTPSLAPTSTRTLTPSETPSSTPLPADLNGDGQVNVLDTQLCVNVVLGMETDPVIVARADVNTDGVVNVLDVQEIVNVMLAI